MPIRFQRSTARATLLGCIAWLVLQHAQTAGAAPSDGPAAQPPASALAAAAAAFEVFDLERASALLNEVERGAGPSVDTLYYRTRIAALRNDPAGAKRAAAACLQRAANASRCHEAMAEAHITEVLTSGNPLSALGPARAAKAAWEKAVQLDPRNTRAALLLLRYCRSAPWVAGGSEDRARELEAALLRIGPGPGQQARALNLVADERFDAAFAAFNAAIQADPGNRDPRIYLTLTQLQAKRWADAARSAEDLVRRYPKFWDGWLMLGQAVLEARLDPERGLAAVRLWQANATNRAKPQQAQAQALLGALLERRGDRAGARAAYQRALALNDENELATAGMKRVGNCC